MILGKDWPTAPPELDSVRLGPIRQDVYGPLFALLEAHGYVRGELDSPDAATPLGLPPPLSRGC